MGPTIEIFSQIPVFDVSAEQLTLIYTPIIQLYLHLFHSIHYLIYQHNPQINILQDCKF